MRVRNRPSVMSKQLLTCFDTLLVDVEAHLVGTEGVGQGEGVDAHRLELRVGLEPL